MTTMLRTILAITMLLIGSASYAQAVESAPSLCWAVAIKGQVVVTMTDGSVQEGTLACLGSTEVVLAGSVGLVMLALCTPHCSAEGVLRVAAVPVARMEDPVPSGVRRGPAEAGHYALRCQGQRIDRWPR